MVILDPLVGEAAVVGHEPCLLNAAAVLEDLGRLLGLLQFLPGHVGVQLRREL